MSGNSTFMLKREPEAGVPAIQAGSDHIGSAHGPVAAALGAPEHFKQTRLASSCLTVLALRKNTVLTDKAHL